MPEWKNRIVGQGEQPASQFLANPNNWRVHPKRQQEAMRGSLNEVGWVQNVMVNVRTGHLVDGHERVWEALLNDDAVVPYIEVDLSEEEEAYILATLDPLGAMAEADKTQLEKLLSEVQTGEAGIAALLADLKEKTDNMLRDATFKEYDETAADNVEYITCPYCGERWPK